MNNKEKKELVCKLRVQGKSLAYIAKSLNVSKSTVSVWVKDIILTESQKNALLEHKRKVARETLSKYSNGRPFGAISKIRRAMGEEAWQEYKRKRQVDNALCWRSQNANWFVNRRRIVKAKLVEYKGGKCERCGYDKCLSALQFHHIDPSKKELKVSSTSRSFESLKIEVDKCSLLCANCHMELHDVEFKQKRSETIKKLEDGLE